MLPRPHWRGTAQSIEPCRLSYARGSSLAWHTWRTHTLGIDFTSPFTDGVHRRRFRTCATSHLIPLYSCGAPHQAVFFFLAAASCPESPPDKWRSSRFGNSAT
ncbi:hypothetical protein K505DRAFT_53217 [Melanomma pulvis-pyrius CBS 109.77]|uniref:Uncharacterized protein n=1 Tax=Melanomma pulvis-pyrius CBS 109.77 TaxID=1314802 RepID=A0A6A6X8Q8_9PLEO|nr:hypothetical protein K505DRAFT_53217 [Melanomma pulvis-pyrius CBS 109.77]